jgi:protein-S-isoprenylcysteine O-methyltransferase Ste14
MASVRRVELRAGVFAAFVVALWAVVLPAMLTRDPAGGFGFEWRSWPLVVAAATALVAGTGLVFYPAIRLAGAGAHLMGTRPGPALVTDGVYGRVRNPADIGSTVIAAASWMALATDLMWVVPAAAIVHYTVGIGLYEDRRLVEAFGDEFKDYRRRVPKWVPRRGSAQS